MALERLPSTEAFVEIKSFSPEAQEALEKKGYVIYPLTGQLFKSLRESEFWASINEYYNPEIEDLTSMRSEVAINPDQLFLPESNRKTFAQQKKMVEKFSRELGREIESVKATIGNLPDYVELAFLHLTAADERLFGPKYNYDFVRTETPAASFDAVQVGNLNFYRRFVYYLEFGLPRYQVVNVGGFNKNGLHIGHGDCLRGNDRIWVAPLVVPA